MESKHLSKRKFVLDMNRSLLAICFTVFALIITLDKELFINNIIIPIQLTLAIPLLLSSTFSRSKLSIKKTKTWEIYGFYTFLIGYSCLINIIGILLSNVVSPFLGITFFSINIITAITYSILSVKEDKKDIHSRIIKDAIFVLLMIYGGILPSIGIY